MAPARTKTRSNPGARLQTARRQGGFSRQEVAERLRVPVTAIKYLDRWELDKLDDTQLNKTIVRRYALLVNLNPTEFEREVPYQKPRQHSQRTMVVLSRLSLSAVAVLAGLAVIGFLAWRTFVATARPTLDISQPPVGLSTDQPSVGVSGRTSGQAQVYVNGFNVPVDPDGGFDTSVILSEGTNTITVTAINSFGRQTEAKRIVQYDP